MVLERIIFKLFNFTFYFDLPINFYSADIGKFNFVNDKIQNKLVKK